MHLVFCVWDSDHQSLEACGKGAPSYWMVTRSRLLSGIRGVRLLLVLTMLFCKILNYRWHVSAVSPALGKPQRQRLWQVLCSNQLVTCWVKGGVGASGCLLTSRVVSALTWEEDISCLGGLGSFSTLPSIALGWSVALGMLSASGYELKVGLFYKDSRSGRNMSLQALGYVYYFTPSVATADRGSLWTGWSWFLLRGGAIMYSLCSDRGTIALWAFMMIPFLIRSWSQDWWDAALLRRPTLCQGVAEGQWIFCCVSCVSPGEVDNTRVISTERFSSLFPERCVFFEPVTGSLPGKAYAVVMPAVCRSARCWGLWWGVGYYGDWLTIDNIILSACKNSHQPFFLNWCRTGLGLVRVVDTWRYAAVSWWYFNLQYTVSLRECKFGINFLWWPMLTIPRDCQLLGLLRPLGQASRWFPLWINLRWGLRW